MPDPSGYGEMFDAASGVQIVWNSTSLKAWDKCPRYYKWTILDGWRSRSESVHLTFGSHYATGHQRYYEFRGAGLDRESAIREVVRLALADTYGWEPDHDKNRWSLIRSIVWYFEVFREDLPVAEINGEPAAEIQFRFEDDGIEFVGQIDQIVVYNGDEVIRDQKTTGGWLGPKYFQAFHLDHQPSLYLLAGYVTAKRQISTFLIDAVRVTATQSEYGRGLTMRTPAQLEEWRNDAHAAIGAAQRATLENKFPPRYSACSMYGGCVFRSICAKSPEMRERHLRLDFVKEPAHD